ncbi:hypothetical protein VRRI112168_02085 [Vreelandella rituensis]
MLVQNGYFGMGFLLLLIFFYLLKGIRYGDKRIVKSRLALNGQK